MGPRQAPEGSRAYHARGIFLEGPAQRGQPGLRWPVSKDDGCVASEPLPAGAPQGGTNKRLTGQGEPFDEGSLFDRPVGSKGVRGVGRVPTPGADLRADIAAEAPVPQQGAQLVRVEEHTAVMVGGRDAQGGDLPPVWIDLAGLKAAAQEGGEWLHGGVGVAHPGLSGDEAWVLTFRRRGEILELENNRGKVVVQVGGVRATVDDTDLFALEDSERGKERRAPKAPPEVDTSTSTGFNLASLVIILMLTGLYAVWW